MNGPGKTLLIVGSLPGSANVGQILLREMLSCVDPERFAIAALLDADSTAAPDAQGSVKAQVFTRPREHATRDRQGRVGRLLAGMNRARAYEPATTTR